MSNQKSKKFLESMGWDYENTESAARAVADEAQIRIDKLKEQATQACKDKETYRQRTNDAEWFLMQSRMILENIECGKPGRAFDRLKKKIEDLQAGLVLSRTNHTDVNKRNMEANNRIDKLEDKLKEIGNRVGRPVAGYTSYEHQKNELEVTIQDVSKIVQDALGVDVCDNCGKKMAPHEIGYLGPKDRGSKECDPFIEFECLCKRCGGMANKEVSHGEKG